jgi:hypothetical protein
MQLFCLTLRLAPLLVLSVFLICMLLSAFLNILSSLETTLPSLDGIKSVTVNLEGEQGY